MRGRGGLGSHLAKLGYKIIDRNFQTRYGEVDIIALHNETIVFVEVKARGGDPLVSPLEAVNYKKQKKIIKCAKEFLVKKKVGMRPVRFDVVAVWLEDAPPRVEVIENAFELVSPWA